MTLCPCSTTSILDGMRIKTVENELATSREPQSSTSTAQWKWWLGYLACLGLSTTAFSQGIITSLKNDFHTNEPASNGFGWFSAASVALFSAKNAIEHYTSLSSITEKNFIPSWLIPTILGGVSAILSTVLQADEGATIPFLICAFLSAMATNGNNFRNYKKIITKTLAVFDTEKRMQQLSTSILDKIESSSQTDQTTLETALNNCEKRTNESEIAFAIRKISLLLKLLDLSYTETTKIETPKTNASNVVGLTSLALAVAGAMPFILNVTRAEILLGDTFSWLALPASILSFSINIFINLGTEVHLGKSLLDKIHTGLFTHSSCRLFNTIKGTLSIVPAAAVAIFYENVTAKSAKRNMPASAATLLAIVTAIVDGLNSLVGTLFAIEKLKPKSKLIAEVSNLFAALYKLPESERNVQLTTLAATTTTDSETAPANTEETRLLSPNQRSDPASTSTNSNSFLSSGHSPGYVESCFGPSVAKFFCCY